MSLKESISRVLPKDKEYELFHFQSKPRETHPLVSQKSSSSIQSDQIKTIKIEHFITLAHESLIFFGIELFIYITINHLENTTEKLLFVSKADTNGQNVSNAKIGPITQVILNHIIQIPIDNYLQEIIPKNPIESTETENTINSKTITKSTGTKEALKILLERHRGNYIKPQVIQPYKISNYPKPIKTKISLFTRSEPQYLFPSSGENPKKHVLGGEGLLKWWLKILDSLILNTFQNDENLQLKLQIPAEDPKIIERYFKNLQNNNWKVGDIFNGNDKDLALYKIPLFPDDPKARFLEHLVVENRAKNVDLRQFWIELQARQEFRLGVTVSVIGIEGFLKTVDNHNDNNDSILLSRRHFKKLKNYITGEDYSDTEGALESYKNIDNYLESQLDQSGMKIIGNFVKPVKPDNLTTATTTSSTVNVLTPVRRKAKEQPVINNLTTQVRKKQKK
ncbi:Histone acetyltransferase [Wickerhamomyces ciferrii]|uniref:histone acetyltransferase n=1 Tax=Wickerhamomyces ciferrii (strain ATCC 14091 / BCRC 22168 / CBS 111 / JCM 3599 / NBRC 0793 / NRRL Y-1031 F-60-10) TaxID=1206466 RepID=K0KPN7_WICCF|nr:Histone acetyltransferase [Wickerhamomyces ciferrii]CCH43128.1 Histone acetyltransferase [Wickerhamomyces ciferrii]